MLWIDFETRSPCDLKAEGVYNYARHADTEVICMSYAFDDGEVQTWRPPARFPVNVWAYSGQIRAHNAAFERLILKYVLKTPHKLEQFYCTATQARANCAPGSLDDVGRFAGVSMRKDHRGAHLVRQCCIPPYSEDPRELAELIAYCEQDVRAMRAASQAMRELSAEELADYHVNERINDRGVRLDRPLALAAVQYAAVETQDIQDHVMRVTNGEITSVRSRKMTQWVYDRVGPQARKLMMSQDKLSIDKAVRGNLLAMEDSDEIPWHVMEVIQAADDIWASSVAKFRRAADLADYDDERVRGAFVFAGGSATGRASSFGLQVHNFPRKALKDPAAARAALVAGQDVTPAYGARVADVLKGMLRPSLIPADGSVFIVADWSAIEARVNPWLSGRGDDKLKLFAEDIYRHNASATFRCTVDEVTDDQRQIGKVQELACGFAGGVGAFAAMGRIYGLHLPEYEARRMVDAWRRANPWAVLFWAELERAYTRAMRNPGREFTAGRITYMFDNTHLWYALPSGRVLCYPYARLETDGVSYARASWKPAADAKEWPRARLWKGLACENVTQATAHDLLRAALRRLDDVVLHVHDEVVLERPADTAREDAAHLQRVMERAPEWAAGLPLKAEAKILERYGK
jgi:DNA polymerase